MLSPLCRQKKKEKNSASLRAYIDVAAVVVAAISFPLSPPTPTFTPNFHRTLPSQFAVPTCVPQTLTRPPAPTTKKPGVRNTGFRGPRIRRKFVGIATAASRMGVLRRKFTDAAGEATRKFAKRG